MERGYWQLQVSNLDYVHTQFWLILLLDSKKIELEDLLDDIQPSLPTQQLTSPTQSSPLPAQPSKHTSTTTKAKIRSVADSGNKRKSSQNKQKAEAQNASILSMSAAILQSHSCKDCTEKDLKLREMEDSLNDARDAIETKKTQIMMLQKELGKMYTERRNEYNFG